jgi:hypothetical protein
MMQQHMQETYKFLFDEAHRALGEGRAFRPFGAGVRKTGQPIETHLAEALDGLDAQTHVAGLVAGLREEDKAHGLMAAGVVFDGQMTDRKGEHGRALVFHLEAANGHAVEVILPYDIRLGIVDFAEPAITPVLPEIFPNAAQ